VPLAALVLAAPAAAGPGLVFAAGGGVVLHSSIRAHRAVRATDATTRNATGIAYLTARTPTGVGAWIAVGKAGGGLAPLSIRVPHDALPGQYFAGLVVGSKQRIVPVEIDVPGSLQARFVVGAVHAGHARLYLHVSITGNVARAPNGVVSVARGSGGTVAQGAFHMAAFLPHTAIDYPLTLGRRLAPGTYTASVRLTYPDAGTAGSDTPSAAPQFTVPVVASFRPRPPGLPAAPAATQAAAGSAWRWIGAAAASLAAVAAGVALVRRRPVTVTVRPLAELTTATRCEGFHYWDVDWQRPEPGPDGATTFPHCCRRCGVEVRAADISDAAAKTAR